MAARAPRAFYSFKLLRHWMYSASEDDQKDQVRRNCLAAESILLCEM